MRSDPRIIYQETVRGVSASPQCNCACSDFVPIQEHDFAIPAQAELQVDADLQAIPLDTIHQVVFVPTGQGSLTSIAVLNDSAWEILSSFKQPNLWELKSVCWYQEWGRSVVAAILNQLVRLRFLYVVGKKELMPVTEYSNTLEAWLHITDTCNLRCSYCYLPHAKVGMTFEMGCDAIDATIRSALIHKYSKIKLKYAGGEAMLRFSLITKLQKYAQDLANSHGLTLESIILSNGTLLTEQTVKTIQALNLRLMISLDGLGQTHDLQRPYANGRGSSRDVIRAVDMALENDLVPYISITVSGRNIQGLPEIVEWVLQRDLPFNLNFYRENDLSTSYEDLKLEEEGIIAGIRAAYNHVKANLPQRSLLASLGDLSNLSLAHSHTCGVGHSYMVFDHLGRVSKCQMQMDKPVTTSKVNDPLALIRADTIGIQNISVEEKSGCRDCEWRHWCSGGCPLTTYRATGRYDVKSPNCNIYKALYPEIVYLEGLRLLKWFSNNDNDAFS